MHESQKPKFSYSLPAGWILFCLPPFLTVINSYFGISSYDSVSGFPFKDASAWANCLKALAFNGSFTEGYGQWCLRRPLFPEITSLIYLPTRSLFIVSLVLSLFFAVALRKIFMELVEFSNFIIASIISLCTISYWYIYCCAQILTEALGSTVCLMGFIFLIKALRTKSLKHIYLSITLFGLSQQIRPGNLFLPLVPILLLRNKPVQKNRTTILCGILFFFAPYFLTRLLGRILALKNYGNSGNAWASLYGLANGNSHWSSAYSIPGISPGSTDAEISQTIKEATLALISSNPFEVVHSIFLNFIQMTTSFFPFVSPISVPSNALALVLNLSIIGFLLLKTFQLIVSREIIKPEFAVLYAILITTIASFAVAWKSEPSRALMPVLPMFFFAILSIGISNRFPATSSKKSESGLDIQLAKKSFLGSLVPASAVLVIVLGLASLSHENEFIRVKPKSLLCAAGEFSLVPNSITSVKADKIKSLSLFSWSQDVRYLNGGVLVQGLAYSDFKYSNFNGFFRGKLTPTSLSDSCFVLEMPQPLLGSFSDSGVRSFKISTSFRNNYNHSRSN